MAEKAKSYFLIGAAQENIRSLRHSELPTLRRILQNFMFHHFEKGESVKIAAKSVIESALLIWNEQNVATKRVDNCERKLIKEYNEWHYLSGYQSNHETLPDKIKDQIAKLTDRLDKVFDLKLTERSSASASEEMDTSEMDTSEMESSVEMEQVEEQPSSSQSVSGIRKRASALKAGEKLEHILGKSSRNDEEGKRNQ